MSIRQETQWGIKCGDAYIQYDDEQDAREHLPVHGPDAELITRLIVTHSWTPVPAGLVQARER